MIVSIFVSAAQSHIGMRESNWWQRLNYSVNALFLFWFQFSNSKMKTFLSLFPSSAVHAIQLSSLHTPWHLDGTNRIFSMNFSSLFLSFVVKCDSLWLNLLLSLTGEAFQFIIDGTMDFRLDRVFNDFYVLPRHRFGLSRCEIYALIIELSNVTHSHRIQKAFNEIASERETPSSSSPMWSFRTPMRFKWVASSECKQYYKIETKTSKHSSNLICAYCSHSRKL